MQVVPQLPATFTRGDLATSCQSGKIGSERYVICTYIRTVRSPMHQSITRSPIVIVVQRTLIDEVELRSIMLFILLLLAFIAILTLRACARPVRR